MINCKIELVEKIPDAINEKMENGLEEYSVSHGIDVNYQPFAFILFDEKNEVVGVLDAFSSYSSIHIRDIWVDKAHRGNGYGRKLIAELENYFKGKGLNNINLITCAYQAPVYLKIPAIYPEKLECVS